MNTTTTTVVARLFNLFNDWAAASEAAWDASRERRDTRAVEQEVDKARAVFAAAAAAAGAPCDTWLIGGAAADPAADKDAKDLWSIWAESNGL